MNTFSDIIDTFGGPLEFANRIGVTYEHARKMRQRNAIPAKHWPAIVRAGVEGVTLDVLADLAERTAA